MTPVDIAFIVFFVACFIIFMAVLAAVSWYVEHDQETPGEKAAHMPHPSIAHAHHA